jgi:hypothetical protein
VLIADQGGIWRVSHQLRGGRVEQHKIDQVPPDQRSPVPGAYAAQPVTDLLALDEGRVQLSISGKGEAGQLSNGLGTRSARRESFS